MGLPTVLFDLVVHRIEPYDTIERLQRAVLPRLNIGNDLIGYLAQNGMGDFGIVHFLDMRGYVAVTHAKTIESYDLVR